MLVGVIGYHSGAGIVKMAEDAGVEPASLLREPPLSMRVRYRSGNLPLYGSTTVTLSLVM